MVSTLGHPGLWDRLRDLNDEINKLIREKGHWEKRIVEMDGPDYAKAAPKVSLSPIPYTINQFIETPRLLNSAMDCCGRMLRASA